MKGKMKIGHFGVVFSAILFVVNCGVTRGEEINILKSKKTLSSVTPVVDRKLEVSLGEPVPLVTGEMIEDGSVSVDLKTTGKVRSTNPDIASFFDGSVDGSSVTANVPLHMYPGSSSTATLTIRFPSPRLLTEAQLVYHCKGLDFSTSLVLFGEGESKRELPIAYARDLHLQPNGFCVSGRRWPGLLQPVTGIRLHLKSHPTSFIQFTELRLLGFMDSAEVAGDRIELLPSERMPVVSAPLNVRVRVARCSETSPEYNKLVTQVLDHTGEVVREDILDLPAAEIGTSAEIDWQLRMPSVPDTYTLRVAATAPDGGRTVVQRDLPVTSRRLHCVWYGTPESTRWGTAYCGSREGAKMLQLREQGVLPLPIHMALHREKGALDLAKFLKQEYHDRFVKGKNPFGIVLEEYSCYKENYAEAEGALLVRSRQKHPDKKQYVWVIGNHEGYMPALRRAADLIMVEVYMNRLGHVYNRFLHRTEPYLLQGLGHKTVIAIATDLGESVEDIEKQIRYIRKNRPSLPGLGIYKTGGESTLQTQPIDELFYKYFVTPVLYCQTSTLYEYRVQVENRGGITARNVRLELVPEAGGPAVGHVNFSEIYPGEIHQVDWLKIIPNLPPAVYMSKFIAPEAYTILNDAPLSCGEKKKSEKKGGQANKKQRI